MANEEQHGRTSTKRKEPEGDGGGARDYHRWKNSPAEACVVEWFQVPDNYDSWKFSKKDKANMGRPNTSKKTRASLERDIVDHLATNGFRKTIVEVRNKIKHMENTYKLACECIVKKTGEGVTEEYEEEGMNSVKDKLLKKCHLFDELHPIFHDRPSMHPPHASDNLDETDPIDSFYKENPEIDMEGVNVEIPQDQNDVEEREHQEENPVLPPSPAAVVPRSTMAKSKEISRKVSNSDQQSQPKQLNVISEAIRAAADQKFVLEDRRLTLEGEKLKQQQIASTINQEDKKAEREFEIRKMEIQNDQLDKQNEKLRLENEQIKLKLELAKQTGKSE